MNNADRKVMNARNRMTDAERRSDIYSETMGPIFAGISLPKTPEPMPDVEADMPEEGP